MDLEGNDTENSLLNKKEKKEDKETLFRNSDTNELITRIKEEWAKVIQDNNLVKAIDANSLKRILVLVPETERLRLLLKEQERYDYQAFYAQYTGVKERQYFKYKSIVDNWDWLEELEPRSIRRALYLIDQRKKEEQKEKAMSMSQEVKQAEALMKKAVTDQLADIKELNVSYQIRISELEKDLETTKKALHRALRTNDLLSSSIQSLIANNVEPSESFIP